MKLLSFLLAALAFTGFAARAEIKTADPARGEFPVVIVDTLIAHGRNRTDFDRLDQAFEKVARQRQWPRAPIAERFTANTPDYPTEIRVVLRSISSYTPEELIFRGWTTVTVDGRKHDLGIIMYRQDLLTGMDMDRTLERLFEGAARAIAEKVEPLLFPDLKPAKK